MQRVSATDIMEQLPYDGKRTTIVDNHKLPDIINAMTKYHKIHRGVYDGISEQYWQGNAKDTARLLFDFCKKYITTRTESDQKQSIKGPGRFLNDGHGDCKHYASYINGVLDSLARKGYPVSSNYRFTADTPGDDVHHVFVVVRDGNQEYQVDPILSSFNQRPQFYNVKDINMLEYLSGTQNGIGYSNDGVGNFLDKLKHSIQVNTANIKKDVKKVEHGISVDAHNAAHAVATGAKNAGHALAVNAANAGKFALKVAVSPARNAFLALLDINAFNMARRLHDTMQVPAQAAELRNEWTKMGGDYGKLQSAVNNGYKHYQKHGNAAVKGCYIGRAFVGFEPTTTASMMALAAAIIAALSRFLKPSAGEQHDMAAAATTGGAALLKNATGTVDANIDNQATTTGDKSITDMLQSGTTGTMDVHASVADDGTTTLQVNTVKHPLLDNAGAPRDDAGNVDSDMSDSAVTPDGTIVKRKVPAGAPGGGWFDSAASFEDHVKDTWTNHKAPIISVGILVLALSNKKLRKKIGI